MQLSIESAIRLYYDLCGMMEFDAFGDGLTPAKYWAVNQPDMYLYGKVKFLPVKDISEMTKDELSGYRQGLGCVEACLTVEFGGCDGEENPLTAPRISVSIHDRRKSGVGCAFYARIGQYAPSEEGFSPAPVELTGAEQIADVLRQLAHNEQTGSLTCSLSP